MHISRRSVNSLSLFAALWLLLHIINVYLLHFRSLVTDLLLVYHKNELADALTDSLMVLVIVVARSFFLKRATDE